MDTPVVTDTPSVADDVYANSAETGIIPGADMDEEEEGLTETRVNAGGLTRTDTGDVDFLSDNRTGNNSMGTSTIGGGFGVGGINTDATLPE